MTTCSQADLKVLMEHDHTLMANHVKPHLKYIPKYLMPPTGATGAMPAISLAAPSTSHRRAPKRKRALSNKVHPTASR